MEALILSAIAVVQAYILTRLDTLDSRLDEMKVEMLATKYRVESLMRRKRTREGDHMEEG